MAEATALGQRQARNTSQGRGRPQRRHGEDAAGLRARYPSRGRAAPVPSCRQPLSGGHLKAPRRVR
eukprot:1805063-Pyramimonas_sp.AAC.1